MITRFSMLIILCLIAGYFVLATWRTQRGPWYVAYICSWSLEQRTVHFQNKMAAERYAAWLRRTDRATDHVQVVRRVAS